MKEKKTQARRVQNHVEEATKKNKRKETQDWHNLYKKALAPLTKDQREIIEFCRQGMLSGINKITRDYGLEELENWESIKESYSYELIIPRIPLYLKGEFSIPQAVQLAKKLSSEKRQGTWFRSLNRQHERLQVYPRDFIIACEEDDDGEMIYEVGAGLPKWMPPIDLLDPYQSDPESFLLRWKEMEAIKILPELLGNSGKKHAHIYKKIFEIQFSGEDVGPEHREMLGIETNKELRELKCQAFRLAAEILADIFPDLKEKQKLYKAQKGKEWEIERSTFPQRREMYKDPYKEVNKLSPVKHTRFVNGVPATSIVHSSPVQPNTVATSL